MKLSRMAYKKVRCVFYEQDGKVLRNHENPEKLMETPIEKVVVYNPTEEEEKLILKILEESRDGDNVQVNGMKVLRLMEMLTDIELGDLTEEQAVEIIANPNELLQAINIELNSIMLNALQRQFHAAQSMAQLPEAIKRPVVEQALEQVMKEQEEKERAEREEQEELERMAELEKQLEELKQKRMSK